ADVRPRKSIDTNAGYQGTYAEKVDLSMLASELNNLTSETVFNIVVDKLNLTKSETFARDTSPLLTTLPFGSSEADRDYARRWAAAGFEKRTSVEIVKGSYSIRVSYSSRDPEFAARVVNAIVDAYRNEQMVAKRTAIEETANQLRRPLEQLSKEVEQADR